MSLVVQVAQGRVEGEALTDGAVWRAIPYAAPARRWRAPASPLAWPGVRACRAPGPACPQNPPGGATSLSLSEDCLTLNVWAPAGAARCPVMVWIHGGALVCGAGSSRFFDGAALIAEGVVLVTITYRLGLFGFLAHPALREDGAVSANLGLHDVIAALRWVRENIGGFGGDPERVTVFGNSAGATLVHALLATPHAAGLFATAIAQSGAVTDPCRTLEEAEAEGARLLPAANRDALEALPAAVIVARTPRMTRLAVDHAVLPRGPAEAQALGLAHRVPLLVGATSYEGSVLAEMGVDPAHALADIDRGRIETIYGADEAALTRAAGDRRYVHATRWVADRAGRAAPVFAYLLDHLPPCLRGRASGAVHGLDVPLIFGTLDATGLPPDGFDDETRALGATMRRHWAAFAATGQPGPGWPAYAPDRSWTVFRDPPSAVRDLWKDRLDLFDAVLSHDPPLNQHGEPSC